MDRFIVLLVSSVLDFFPYLKSSMDRFIVFSNMNSVIGGYNLKSSMDRFIERRLLMIVLSTEI